MTNQRGFSILEMTVAMAVMLAVTGGIFAIVNPSQGMFQTQTEVSDMQQRLRVVSDTLYKDLIMAGGGVYAGSNSGSLLYYFAPVLPSRQGQINDDPPGTYRSDTVTLMYIPANAPQTSINQPMPGVSPELKVTDVPDGQCPTNDTRNLCGFDIGQTVLVFDGTGDVGTFTVTQVQDAAGHLQINRAGNDTTFPIGAKIAQATSVTYFLNAATSQLMFYDGSANPDVPVVDNVVGLKFEYYGDPQPPQLTGVPLTSQVGPWTTYGPPPPAVGTQIPSGGYPAGENCTFQMANGQQVPRLDVLGAGGGSTTLVKLTSAQLTDGPWCPDPANVNRWDADLLRIRKIAITIRVQSAVASLRGPASALFTKGGTSKDGNRWVPDQQMTFSVTPRNMNLGR